MSDEKERDWLDRFLQMQQSLRVEEIKSDVDELKAEARDLAAHADQNQQLLREVESETQQTLKALLRTEDRQRYLKDLKNRVFDIERVIEIVGALKDKVVQHAFLRAHRDELTGALQAATKEMDTLSEKKYTSAVEKKLQDIHLDVEETIDPDEMKRYDDIVDSSSRLKKTKRDMESLRSSLRLKKRQEEDDLARLVVGQPTEPPSVEKPTTAIIMIGAGACFYTLAGISQAAPIWMLAVGPVLWLFISYLLRRGYRKGLRRRAELLRGLADSVRTQKAEVQRQRQAAQSRLSQIDEEIHKCETAIEKIDGERQSYVGDIIGKFVRDHPEYAKVKGILGI